MTERRPGRLIALEGIDGCGKSTQARLLAGRLGALLTFEPGGTGLGRSLRALLLDRGREPIGERAEALLMAADRAQHVAEVVAPALRAGRWVVTDRFSASTIAYQGFGRGLDRNELTTLVGWATGGLGPDLTVLLTVPLAVAAARRGDGAGDHFEIQGEPFLERVDAGYRRLAGEAATPWRVVEATGPVEVVAGAVWAAVDAVLGPVPADG